MKYFISSTNEINGSFNKLTVLQDCQFEKLEITELKKDEGAGKLAGTGAILIYAGTEFTGRITKVKLYSGAVILE